MAASYKILLVDDEDMVRSVIRSMLEAFGYVVVEAATDSWDWTDSPQRNRPGLYDLQMPQLDGLGFISCLKEISRKPIIVISGTGMFKVPWKPFVWRVDYVTKPVEALECLDIAAQRVLERAPDF
jgi:CheY-like chemotaxis protein